MPVASRAALAIALCLQLSRISGAQDPTRPLVPQIVTTGQGEVRVAPDRATISIGVQTRASTAAAASASNARKQASVISAIRGQGVPASQISTAGFTVQPEMRYDRPGTPPVVTGYLVTNAVMVELQRTDIVGTVIDASLAAGANQVNGLTFSISDADSARRIALGLAVNRAKGDAEAAARAAGGSLGTLIEMTASEFESPIYRTSAMAVRMSEAPVNTQIEAGLQPVRATVTARWQFIPASP